MRKDLASSLFWLALSVFVCAEGVRMKLWELQRPGPGFFPFWAGVALGVLSVLNLLRSSKKRDERISLSGVRWPTLLLVLGAILVYFLCLEQIGFLIVTFLLLLLLFRLERKGWVFAGVWSVAATLAAYAFFQLLLQTQLPKGLLGY